jgi:hypothetical protein
VSLFEFGCLVVKSEKRYVNQKNADVYDVNLRKYLRRLRQLEDRAIFPVSTMIWVEKILTEFNSKTAIKI